MKILNFKSKLLPPRYVIVIYRLSSTQTLNTVSQIRRYHDWTDAAKGSIAQQANLCLSALEEFAQQEAAHCRDRAEGLIDIGTHMSRLLEVSLSATTKLEDRIRFLEGELRKRGVFASDLAKLEASRDNVS